MSSPIERLNEIKAKAAGHTPGPWGETRAYPWVETRSYIVNAARGLESDINGEAWKEKDRSSFEGAVSANIGLIAAAPDLLDIATALAGEVERLRDALELAAEGEAEMLAENKRLRTERDWLRRIIGQWAESLQWADTYMDYQTELLRRAHDVLTGRIVGVEVVREIITEIREAIGKDA